MKQCHLIISASFITQEVFAKQLIDCFNLSKIRMKDLLINELRNESKLSDSINEYLKSGKLIPTSLITALLRKKISVIKNDLLIIGYPKTKEQFTTLNDLLSNSGYKISKLWILNFQNVDKQFSISNDREMTKKFIEQAKKSKLIEELVNDSTITSKINIETINTWDSETMKQKIISMHRI
ncbi:nucleoside monophosphate kinase [Nonlabens sp. Asnod3-A02]|uniref:nucleoside monophosphate kinase n=1 Tax=Nonlabens sp. Asnod3-A02 TaxID=3160579 RepID=UPI00386F5ADF